MSEFGIRALPIAGLSGRFTITRIGPFRQSDTLSKPADATAPESTGFSGNGIPAAGNRVGPSDEILRAAIRFGGQEPGGSHADARAPFPT